MYDLLSSIFLDLFTGKYDKELAEDWKNSNPVA